MPPSTSIIPRRRRVIVYSWPVLCVCYGIIICEILLLLLTRLHQLILNLLMKTVNPCIIAINRSCSHIVWLLGSSSVLQNLNRRFNLIVSGAHQYSIVVIGHLLGVGLHIVRLRGGASVWASSHDVGIEFPLWVGACSHFIATNLRRRRVCIHRHLYATRVEISGCLVHEILSHRNGGTPSGAHQRLLGINWLLPWGLSVLKDLLLLLKHHPNIWLLLLLFSFLKF
jgi:hypothetical protein